jgi:AcrR family transcriptional regulator
MVPKKDATKKRIMDVTLSLLENTENPEDITIRRIAEDAGIGIGLINYHFTSRDKLINEVISLKMNSLSGSMIHLEEQIVDPVKYLKEMLIMMSDIAIKNSKLNKISVEYELLHGDFKICLTLLPLLKKIFEERKTDTEIRFIAYQIITTTQSIYLRQDAFHMYAGVNIENKKERDMLLNQLVDNLVK